ncbi:MAG: hypothetical protein MUF34_13765 [Polyangiaceae bacterium]|nr:hypothetical protein [Polyangiaceae bacterium]
MNLRTPTFASAAALIAAFCCTSTASAQDQRQPQGDPGAQPPPALPPPPGGVAPGYPAPGAPPNGPAGAPPYGAQPPYGASPPPNGVPPQPPSGTAPAVLPGMGPANGPITSQGTPGAPPSVQAKDANAAPVGPQPGDVIRRSDFMDTRLTWSFGDDDITKATGEVTPLSPNASVGDRPQYRLFFDNLNSRFAGRENLSHLVLYRKMPGFLPNLETEAALVLRFDIAELAARNNNINSSLYDSGSYLRLFYRTHKGEDGARDQGFDLVLFPLDTDRFRLGYLYDISWGGTAQSINESVFPRLVGAAPGAKLQYWGKKFYAFAGFKTAQIVELQQSVDQEELDSTRVQQTNYGGLVGGGVDFTDFLRADVGAGYFQQGRFEEGGVSGERVYTYGFSGRLVLHDKMPVPASVDFALYRNDPANPMVIFRPENYTPGQLSWAVTAETSHLQQHLKDFNAANGTSLQGATAAALQGTVKYGYSRFQVTGLYRDLAFVVKNQPGYIPFNTMPNDAELQPEFFFAAAVDHNLPGLHLTPSLGAGLQLPATFSSNSVDLAGADLSRTVVVRRQGNISQLPINEARVPIVQARASLRWDLSPMMNAMVWGQLVRDNNGTFLGRTASGEVLSRTFVSPNFIGFGTAVQARF